jgi:hypothetical protein
MGQKPGFSNGVALLGTVQEFTAGHSFRTVDMTSEVMSFGGTDYTTFVWDPCTAQVARIVLSPKSGVTRFALVIGTGEAFGASSLKDGATSIVIIKQDATGNRVLKFDSVIKFPNGVEPTVSVGANTTTVMSFVCDGSRLLASTNFNYPMT